MAVKKTQDRKSKNEPPGLFDHLDRMSAIKISPLRAAETGPEARAPRLPAVKIGGVSAAYVPAADFEAEEGEAEFGDAFPAEPDDSTTERDEPAADVSIAVADEADEESAKTADLDLMDEGDDEREDPVSAEEPSAFQPDLKLFDDEDDPDADADEPSADEDDVEEDDLTPASTVKKQRTKNSRGAKSKPARATKAAPPAKPAADEVPAPAAKPAETRKKKKPVTAEMLAGQQRDISVSEFFAKNRHLLGFDNKRKALLTTIKEAVDNSLDACEEAGILPELHVEIIQLAEERFRVRIRDNGPGIVKSQIPNIFGKLLYGSKFHRLKMSRGQQGIGISAAGMYGMLTTGSSVEITSRTGAGKAAHHFHIQIDTAKNRPDIIRDEEIAVDWEQGTEVAIELIASYNKGRQSVDEYIEQTAIANPHALIHYTSPVPEHREFPRGTEDLPAETREIQPHPHGIELGVLMKMLKESKGVKLSGFLQHSFCRVSPTVAENICAAAGLSTQAAPNTIGTHEVEKLYSAIQTVKIMAPPTDCLAPIGVRNLLAGLLKEVKGEFYTATTRNPAVYRGNPFQIEIGMAYGGKLEPEGAARVIRFANRVPLLYQQSACAAFKSVLDVDWRNYGMSQPGGSAPIGPLVVMVHMASVWVPFTSESKEAIADYDEIRKEIKLALQECGRKLATYVRRRRRQKLESQKRDIFSRYIPDVADALANLTGTSDERLLKDLAAIAKQRTAVADIELDEDGRPIEKPADAEETQLNGDDSTVIVPENEAEIVPDDLFDEDDENGGGKPKRRKRRK